MYRVKLRVIFTIIKGYYKIYNNTKYKIIKIKHTKYPLAYRYIHIYTPHIIHSNMHQSPTHSPMHPSYKPYTPHTSPTHAPLFTSIKLINHYLQLFTRVNTSA